MAIRTLLLTAVLIAGVAAPMAQAQLLGLIRINGTVPCGIGTTTSIATAPFPNALVQLRCGGNVISSTTTNSAGVFTMLLNPITTLLSSLLTDCKLVVNTPLSTCNASLPVNGILQSALQLLTSIISGILGIVDVIPSGFSLIQGLN